MRHGMQCATTLAPHMRKGETAEPRSFMLRPPPERELTPRETVDFFSSFAPGGTTKKD